jgi:phosphoribosyl-ATP pyrophosphohydrolase
MKGKAVKLVNGDLTKQKFSADALILAKEFSVYPEINLIDLDAAFGTGDNLELIEEICRICNCNVGGGVRTVEKAYGLLKAGANKIIIGTKATEEFLSKLPKEKVIVAIDSRRGKITDKGWKRQRKETPFDKIKKLENYCSGFLYTYVDKEGTMKGIDRDTTKKLLKITDKKIYYAGGISNKYDVLELENINVNPVVGMAYYENRIDYADLFVSILDFEKNNGIIPTIVQDTSGQVLMLAYSSKESVLKALKERSGIYYSRSKKRLWKKGETSGNYQELIRINIDCDKDALLFTVKQKNIACHTGRYSCFEEKEFSFERLFEIIESKKGKKTFTGSLFKDDALLKKKILEEASEVANFRDKDNLKWEVADLLYFIFILMEKNKLELKNIENELMTRNEMKNYIKTTKL